MRRIVFWGMVAAVVFGLASGSMDAHANTIVVANDEWELSNTGFANAPGSTQTFVANLVAEFGPKIHAHSTNFGFTQSSLQTAMTAAGATYTTGLLGTFDLPTLAAYDAIFLGGNYLTAAQIGTLKNYVAGGGSVYLAGGTGVGGAAAEAAAWNGFLSTYGLSFAPTYNGVGGNIAVSGDPIFTGVSVLYQNNGNSISGPGVVCCGGTGLYAVVRFAEQVPEPSTIALLLTAGGGVLLARRRRR